MRDVFLTYSIESVLNTRVAVPVHTETLTVSNVDSNRTTITCSTMPTIDNTPDPDTALTAAQCQYAVLNFSNGIVRVPYEVNLSNKTFKFRMPLPAGTFSSVSFSTDPLASTNVFVGSGPESDLQVMFFIGDTIEFNKALGSGHNIYGATFEDDQGFIIVRYNHKVGAGETYKTGHYTLMYLVNQIKESLKNELPDNCFRIQFPRTSVSAEIEKANVKKVVYQATISFSVQGSI